MNRPADRQAGFTLVEALVSLFVFGLLAAGSVVMLTSGVETRERLSEAEAELRRLSVAQAVLAGDLAQALPTAPGEGPAAKNAFIGQGAGAVADRRIAFARAKVDLPIEAPSSGGPALAVTSAIDVEYRVDAQGRLIRRTLARGASADAVRERVLFASAKSIRFEFNDGLRWREDWAANVAARPAAVAMVVDLPRYGEVRLSAFAGSS